MAWDDRLWTLALASVLAVPAAQAQADVCDTPLENSVSNQQLRELTQAQNAFGLDLYRELKREDKENLFYSPLSISTALAMTYAGARGDTESAMAETLRVPYTGSLFHQANHKLSYILNCRPEAAYELVTANALWGQKDYGFRQNFLSLLESQYGSGLKLLDFQEDSEAARNTINDWVYDQTRERIENLLPQGSVDALTTLVLTNAIFYKGTWLHEFDPDQTSEGVFSVSAEQSTTVPMMRMTKELSYYENEKIQALEMPILAKDEGAESDQTFLILLPKEAEGLSSLERSLTARDLSEIRSNMESRNVRLKLPKFSFESDVSLKKVLSDLGMEVAFKPERANFSGMYEQGEMPLFLSDAFHKAFIDVHEKGLEAAAATAVVLTRYSAAPPPAEFTADHPFMFMIIDEPTDSIFFAGRLADPSS